MTLDLHASHCAGVKSSNSIKMLGSVEESSVLWKEQELGPGAAANAGVSKPFDAVAATQIWIVGIALAEVHMDQGRPPFRGLRPAVRVVLTAQGSRWSRADHENPLD